MDDLKNEVKTRIREILSIFIDAIFLFVWAVVQTLTAYVLENLSIEQWVCWGFRGFFGLSTLAVVIIWLYTDVRIMWIRAKSKVDREREEMYDKCKDTKGTETQ